MTSNYFTVVIKNVCSTNHVILFTYKDTSHKKSI